MTLSPVSCPACGSEMKLSRKRGLWICADIDCGTSVAIENLPTAQPSEYESWPALLARPLADLHGEVNPVVRLHRLCDSAEILARFCAIVALVDLAAIAPEAHRKLLTGVLSQQSKRPTFGVWRELLSGAASALQLEQCAAPDLVQWSRTRLVPLLRDSDGERRAFVALRNDVAHGSVVNHANARQLLDAHEPAFRSTLHSAQGWMALLAAGEARGTHVRVTRGPQGRLEQVEVPAPLHAECARYAGKIVLLSERRILQLWPLVTEPDGSGASADHAAATGIYARAERDGLLYSMLWGAAPWSRSKDGLEAFDALFNVAAERRATNTARSEDFVEEIRNEGARLVGRRAELRALKDAIAATSEGMLWVGGTAGIGKSTLAARVATDLMNGARQRVIAYRFRAGDARCRARGFLKLALREVGAFLVERRLADREPEIDDQLGDDEIASQLREILLKVGATEPGAKGPARGILFVLDGLDEVIRYDADFIGAIVRLQAPGVLWLLVGRPELSIERQLLRHGAGSVFPGGLSRMNDADIRQMLLEGLGTRRYDLVRRDGALEGDNPFVSAVVQRSEGLPLYVRHVVEDVVRGAIRVSDESSLPEGLVAYYDELVRRLGLGDLDWMLPFLATTVAWAESPTTEEGLQELLCRRFPLQGKRGSDLVSTGIERLGAMLRRIPAAGVRVLGVAPYHDTLRHHLRTTPALAVATELVRHTFADASTSIRESDERGHLRQYLLRHGAGHLVDMGRHVEALDVVEWILDGEHGLDNDTLESVARETLISLGGCDDAARSKLSKRALQLSIARANEHSYIRLLPALQSLLRDEGDTDSMLEQLVENEIWASMFGAAIVLAPRLVGTDRDLGGILALAASENFHARELGLYTLKNVAVAERDPKRRADRLSDFLLERRHQRYSILSEALLNLALEGESVSAFIREHRLLEVRYPYLHVAFSAAIAAEAMYRHGEPDASWPASVWVEFELARATEARRRELLDGPCPLHPVVRECLEGFGSLPTNLVALRGLGAALVESEQLSALAHVLLAHPAWEVRNSVAEAFSAAARRRHEVTSVCRALLDSEDWRLRYGATNLAYALRFQDRELTTEVMRRAALDSHAWVAGLAADFLFDRFGGAPRATQERMLQEQAEHLDQLAQSRDMWAAYSLFHFSETLRAENWLDACPQPRPGSVLHSIPGWQHMDALEFYQHLDRLL